MTNRHRTLSLTGLMTGLAVAGISLHLVLVTTGCSGGDDGPEGGATIQGTVDSFSGGGAFYMPQPEPTWGEAVASLVADLIAPEAQAAVAGVTVRLEGTDLSGTTDDRGFFILSGAPGGDRNLIFELNGQTARLPVSVPDDGLVTLDNVRVNNGSVGVNRVTVIAANNANDNQGNANDNVAANVNRNNNTSANTNTNLNRNDNRDDDNGNDNSAVGNTNTNSNRNDNDDDNDDDDDDDDNRNGNRR